MMTAAVAVACLILWQILPTSKAVGRPARAIIVGVLLGLVLSALYQH